MKLSISMESIQLAGLARFDGLAGLMTSLELAKLTKLAEFVGLMKSAKMNEWELGD